MHHGLGSSLIHGYACSGVRSDTQEAASVVFIANYLNIVWYRMYFHCTAHSFKTNSCCYVLIISGKSDVSAGGRKTKTEGNGECCFF
jgi:hypothetical protein